jgi:hypothetical protein
MLHSVRRRLGRPPGPSANRGPRPWDPIRMTFREYAILCFVADNPYMPQWLIAKRFGISPARLSTLTCCPLGQRYLGVLRKFQPLED